MMRSLAVFLLLSVSTLTAAARPNVVTLLVDDLGYRDLGCYGGPVKTPVLDGLAAGGVRFTDFHSGAPTCSPSRATFLTGRQNPRTGVYSVLDERFHRMHLLESETTIAELLKENGYATAHFGKWHLGMPVQNRDNPTPADHGFDYWFGLVNGPGPSHKNPTNFLRNGRRVGPIKGYSCQIVVDEALTWLDQKRDGDEPFFLNLWFNEPHDPIAAPDEIVSQYGALHEREAIYSGTIDNTDRAIGRLVAKLKKLGELDNTIIIYSSDNGSYLQARNGELRGKKGALFEGGHRVPGIFYWKGGIPGGRVEDEPAGAVDLLPTLCGLIGIDKPEGVHLDGSDLAPLLTGSGTFERHQPLFWMSDANMVMRVGDHTLFASSTAKSPIDFKTADRLMEQVKEVLGDDLEKELGGMNLRSRMFNGNFGNPEANRLRAQFRRLYYFQESWIPELKKSGLGRVQLYDLSKDPGQKDNIALKRPELAARLKEQAVAIYRSVMADAPEWVSTEETSPAPPSKRNISSEAFADNWHQWRGPDNNGVSRTAQPPLEWSEEKNLRWKTEIKGNGTGSPIVWGDKVFVTTAINTGQVDPSLPKPEDQPERVFGIKYPNTSYQMIVLCLDRRTGKQLWRRVAKTLVPHEGHHRDASFASASPFCDGQRLYCWFGSAGLFAYSLDGEKLWERDLGRAKVGASLGEGSSPVVHDGKLVLVRDHAGQSTIECLEAATGKTVWKKDRDEKNAWATPAIAEYNGVTQVITTASKKVRSYNLNTGDIIWEAEGLTGNCIPSPIVDGDVVYCMSGYQGYSLLAIPITGEGDVTDSIKWKVERGTPYVPSPILYDGLLYVTQSNQNIMTCLDAKDGSEVIKRVRLPGIGDLYSSPVGAAGRIYMTDRKGTVLVLKQGRELKVLSTNQLDDSFHASPTLAGKQMFLRGKRFLYCVEEGGTAGGKSIASGAPKSTRALLEEITKREIPRDYPGGEGHQPFVDKWFKNAPPEKAGEVARLWKEQRRLFPDMKNRGESFIKILDYVRTSGNSTSAKPPLSEDPFAQGEANPHIKRKVKAEIRREPGKPAGKMGSVSGRVENSSGIGMGGVMISAMDPDRRQSTSVFSQADGSFRIDSLHEGTFRIRARLAGQRDKWIENVELGQDAISITMVPAAGKELEAQRPATSAFAQLKFDSPRDRLNFKMMCAYCHQIGTPAFRTPEEPVDWETMITRMDGFGGLYPHTKKTIVQRIIDTYKDDAVDRWPEYVPPPAPTGMVTKAKITAWELGEPYTGSFHDLEVGDDGLAYVVHIGKQYTATLDPKTGERIYYRLPRGSHGPHSIEPDNDGEMWLTLCVSGEMAKFDLKTKEYTILSSAEPPAERGSWPHTLRVDPKDPEGYIWYTDAGRNSVFRLHPKTLERKEYHLLEAGQVKAGGKGESRGITPYGLDYSPVDGMIWYSKLNGNRIGRIDPKAPDGDVTEWNPPFRGPRRLHVAPDGMVWVPGFGSGVFGKFNPRTEKWTTYPLPDYLNQIPYALNVAPDGMVWICGTGNDTLYRFNPQTEYLVEFPLPFRVSYTREIEFGKDGSVWTSTSGPARHMENACGTLIKLEIPKDAEETGGMKLAPIELSLEEQGVMSAEARQEQAARLGALLSKIEARALPKEYHNEPHQEYVDRIMASLTEDQRSRVGRLFNQRRKAEVSMENAGHSFVRILDYVAKGGRATEIPAEPGPGTTPPPPKEMETGKAIVEAIQSGKFDAAPFDAVKVALAQKDPNVRGSALSAAFGRLGGGVGGVKLDVVVERLNSLGNERDRDFAKNGLAHGLISSDPEAALEWANSVSDNGFRKTVVKNVTRRIDAQPSQPKKGAPSGVAPKSIEQKTGVHRLDSSLRSPFDAFVYVNRIPDKPTQGETAHQFAGRIHGRLANQEGRVLLKLPPGMDRAAYDGFKTFLGSEGNAKVTNCAACHSSPGFAISSGRSLRDGKWSASEFEKILRDKMQRAARGDAEYAGLKITEGDVPNLIAFQKTLTAVNDEEFRDLILGAKVVDVTAEQAPSLTGTVRFEGAPPERKRLPMDEASRKLYDGTPALDESILVGLSGGLANVFVYVKSPVRGDFPPPNAPAVIDQQKSVFRPRVQGLRVGQELVMKNGDPFIHNIRSLSRKNRPFNIAQPAGSPDRKKTFEAAEGPITIKCDFHPWMTAHFWVMDHPFFAVTDAAGRFSIPDLPPGDYSLAAWHEVYGEQEVKVTVGKRTPSETGFTFSPKKE